MAEQEYASGGEGGNGVAANQSQARPAVTSNLPNPSGRQELVLVLLAIVILIRLTLSGVLGKAWSTLTGGK